MIKFNKASRREEANKQRIIVFFLLICKARECKWKMESARKVS
jgi:hypothetical protein